MKAPTISADVPQPIVRLEPLTLVQALKIVNARDDATNQPFELSLATGFEPLHVATFLQAHLRTRLGGRPVAIEKGLFGDQLGNLRRFAAARPRVAVAIFEWVDFEPRLGLRARGAWNTDSHSDIEAGLAGRAQLLLEAVRSISAETAVILCGPTLPLLPLPPHVSARANRLNLAVRSRVSNFLAEAASLPNVRIIDSDTLARVSNPASRFDPGSELLMGFPYRLEHASALAGLLAELLVPRPAKKGLITDLDNTLWRGILGEDGVEGVSWQLDGGGHLHGIFQEFLAGLAARGVLLAIASKNDPILVKELFARRRLALDPDVFFPVEAGWGAKSDAVSRILARWNIGAADVVVVDDSAMEIAEVSRVHPEIAGMPFPANARGAVDFFRALADLFGRDGTTAEDALRATSIRASAAAPASPAMQTAFLAEAEAEMTLNFEYSPRDTRVCELINKTNQFNLNGVRYTKPDLDDYAAKPDTFFLAVEYKDKYGPLGNIAVLLGQRNGPLLALKTWVMSCRAFSRHIEYKCLEVLFHRAGVERIEFAFTATPRNAPFAQFLAQVANPANVVTKEHFVRIKPPLAHKVRIVSDEND